MASLVIVFGFMGFVLSKFYQLSVGFQIGMILIWILFSFAYQRGKGKAEKRLTQFQEAITYMEQLLFTFQSKKKILGSLLDIQPLFADSPMGTVIEEACDYIRNGEETNRGFRGANELIEEKYPCQRIRRIHRFLEHVEEYGGDYEIGIRALQEDLGMYISRTEMLMQEKEQIRKRIIFAILIAMLICGVGVHFMPDQFQVKSSLVSQIASIIMVLLNFLMYGVAQERLLSNWLTEHDTKVAAYDLRDYKKVTEGKKKSGFGYKIAYRRSKKVLLREFPVWVLEVVLFLDRGNVQMALANSRPFAHPIMKAGVDQLLEHLEQEPHSIQPYFDFMRCYQISFIQTVMKVLYGISEIGGTKGSDQLEGLLSRNQLLCNQSEVESNKTCLAGMGLFTLFPMLTGSLKLMIDMVVFIVAFLGVMKWSV